MSALVISLMREIQRPMHLSSLYLLGFGSSLLHVEQRPTDFPACHPSISSSFSNTEHLLQIGTAQSMHMYLVKSEHELQNKLQYSSSPSPAIFVYFAVKLSSAHVIYKQSSEIICQNN